MNNFRQLTIWKEAILTAKKVHAIAKYLPVDERYALANQLIEPPYRFHLISLKGHPDNPIKISATS